MSSQLQYLLIGACILGFAAMEFITRRYQAPCAATRQPTTPGWRC
jgi:hypothetical protein